LWDAAMSDATMLSAVSANAAAAGPIMVRDSTGQFRTSPGCTMMLLWPTVWKVVVQKKSSVSRSSLCCSSMKKSVNPCPQRKNVKKRPKRPFLRAPRRLKAENRGLIGKAAGRLWLLGNALFEERAKMYINPEKFVLRSKREIDKPTFDKAIGYKGFDELVENIMVISKFATDLECDLEDLKGHLGIVQAAIDNIQDVLTDIMLTQGPAHASSHPTLLSPGPAQGQDRAKAGSQGKETRQ